MHNKCKFVLHETKFLLHASRQHVLYNNIVPSKSVLTWPCLILQTEVKTYSCGPKVIHMPRADNLVSVPLGNYNPGPGCSKAD